MTRKRLQQTSKDAARASRNEEARQKMKPKSKNGSSTRKK